MARKFLIALMLALFILTSCALAADVDHLAGKRIGVQTGTLNPEVVKKFIPTAKLEYFDTMSDILTALKAGRIDAFCTGLPIARFMAIENDDITLLEPLSTLDAAPIFPKTEAGEKLCAKFTEFIKAQWDNGTIQELDSIWFGQDESKRVVKDYSTLSATNGTLKMAVDVSIVPFAYVKDNKIVGYDVDTAVKFCEAYGYGLEVVPMSFGGIIPALQSGKCDFAACSIARSKEIAEQVLFAYPNAKTGNVIVVMKSDTVQKTSGGYSNIQDLAGKRIAVLTGSIHPDLALKFVPTAKLVYFDTVPDTFNALKTGKVDAVCTGISMAKLVMAEDDTIAFLGEQLTYTESAPIFSKTENGRKLCEQFSEFLKAQWDNGTIQELDSIWFGNDENRKVVKDYSKFQAPNGILKMAADVSIPPFTYVKDNMIVGYDVDIAVRFCEAYGYGLEIIPMNFNRVIPTVQSGKCDFGMGGITRTDEREESVLFSYPNIKSGNSFVVMKSDIASENPGIYRSLKELEGKRIGVQTGTLSAKLVAEKLPNARIEYFDALSDILIALKTGKVDALGCTIFAATDMMNHNDDVIYLDEWLRTSDLSPIFTKSERGQKICKEYGEFVKTLWEDGTISNLESIWLGKDESKKIMKDYSNLPAPNGVLKIGVDTSWPPLAYVRDNMVVGYDIDIAVRFCEAKGYGLEIFPSSVAGIIAAVGSGKCDFSISMNYTEERAQVALFSPTPTAKSGNVIVVLKDIQAANSEGYVSIQDLAGKRIGVQAGTRTPEVVKKFIPTAKLVYHDTPTDNLIALRTGKVDAISLAEHTARVMMIDNKDIVFLGERLTSVDMAVIFPKTEKGRELQKEYSEFVKSLIDDGTIREIDAVWLGNDENRKNVKDYSKFPAPNGTLNMAVDTSMLPFVYVKDNKIVGYDINIAVKFCEAKGYGLKIVPMAFPAIIPSVNTSKCDFSCALTYSPERAESVLFSSVPNATSGRCMIILKQKQKLQTHTSLQDSQTPGTDDDVSSFINELKASFKRTFIREDRWKLFVEGIINTIIITVMSILFGTILGFIVYLSCRGRNLIANLITRFFIWLIRGMPMVVLLMILYYIVFGKVDIAGIWVAIIAFTLTFGAGVYGMLLSGVNALDKGQLEAAYALGFTDRRAFFTIILPQAALHFMPAYKGEVVALIKATAIVGYIAVQDLTKMGDIVRSRTYEAFFPLIAVAVIYFVLAGMLNMIVGIIHNRIRPEKRTRNDILRGIEIHD